MPSPRILIVTQPRDAHAYAVAEALRLKGAEAVLWHSSDFPMRSFETVRFESQEMAIHIHGPDIDEFEPRFDTVWNRRPAYAVNENALHPADLEFAELGCKVFRRSFFEILARDAFWVNPHDAVRRESKLVQLALAAEVGLVVPDTTITNDPEEVRRFLRTHEGKVVYKPLKTLPWSDGDSYWMPYTNLLTEDLLIADEPLRAAPAIYQELVPKDYELRLTIMGNRAFPAKVLSQQTSTGRLDWRRAYQELEFQRVELPAAVIERCIEMMRRLGIVFGCFDLIVTPDGSYIFLEINQMGQFLFVEKYCALPLLDAFSEFLLQASPDFKWEETETSVRYSALEPQIAQIVDEQTERHEPLPPQYWHEEGRARNGAKRVFGPEA